MFSQSNPNYTDCKYMRQCDFIDFCKNNSIEVNEYLLESFEREKLIYPVKRLIVPEEYAIYKEQQFFKSDKTEINPKHISLIKLDEKYFQFLNYFNSNIVYHPFDDIDEEWQKYLIEPKNKKFNNWNDYEVFYDDKQGNKLKITKCENFYSYWQIYEIDAINKFRLTYLNVRFDNENNKFDLYCDGQLVTKYFKYTRKAILSFASFELHYDCLCEFIQFYMRCQDIAFKEKKIGEYLTQEESIVFKRILQFSQIKLLKITT